MKTKTWLPVFPGFYGTLYEPDVEMEMERIREERADRKLSELPFDAVKFDYWTYQNEIAEKCVQFVERELEGYVKKISFEKISSPREYNFTNDAIHIEVETNEANRDNIRAYLSANFEQFETYIRERYTSYDGFLSHYSNNVHDWMDKECLQDEHKLGAILDFIIRNLFEDGDVEDEMLYFAEGVYLSAENYDECTVMEYCAVCNEFYKPELRKGNICPECFEANRRDLDVICCAECGEEITSPECKRSFIYQLKHGKIQPDQVFCDVHQLIHA